MGLSSYLSILIFFRNVAFIELLGSCGRKISKSICLPNDYSKYTLPDEKSPNKIGVSLDISELLEINEVDQSVKLALFFNLDWTENRLMVGSKTETSTTLSPVRESLLEALWVPNVFIYNLKAFRNLETISALKGLWLSTNKDVLTSQSVHISFYCPMNFEMFPFDKQHCEFKLGSYSYNDNKLLFTTKSFGFSQLESNQIPLPFEISKDSVKIFYL